MKFFLKTAFFLSLFTSVLFMLQCERMDIFNKAQGSEGPALKVLLTGDNNTDESGKNTTIEIKLNQEPVADVTVAVSLDSTGVNEAVISPSSFILSNTTWNIGTVVTVTGIDDNIYNDNQPYTVTFTTSSSDVNYHDITKEVYLNNYSYDRYIFITTDTREGSFGSVSVADDLCKLHGASIDSALTYKAVIVDGSSRVASIAEGRVDWILTPNAHYYRSDGSSFGYTNGDAYFIFGDSSHPMSQLTPAAVDIWTGMKNDWTTGMTCSEWTGAGDGAYGNSASMDDTLIYSGEIAPGSSLNFLCVQQ